MKKLIVIQPCIISGGKSAERGHVVEADDRDTYALIAAGRALDLATQEGKEAKAEIEGEISDAKAKVTAKK